MANTKALPLVRVDVWDEASALDPYYPVRCGNDYCTANGEYRFGWGEPQGEAVCSFDCWLVVRKGR